MSMSGPEQHRIFSTVERIAIGLTGLLAFLLGMLGFHELYTALGTSTTISDLIYQSSRLFLLDFPDHFDLPLTLDIARWMAPATLSYTVFRTLTVVAQGYFQRLKIRYLKQHAILVGLDANTLRIAESLRQDGIKTVVIEADNQHPLWGSLNKPGLYRIADNPLRPGLLASLNLSQARYLIASTHQDTTNIELIYSANAWMEQHSADKYLHTVCCIQDSALMDALCSLPLFSVNHASMSTRIVNYDEAAARVLLNHFGPDRFIPNLPEREQLCITLIGDDPVVKDIVLRFAETGIYGTREKLNIRLVGQQSQAMITQMTTLYPALNELIYLEAHNTARIDRTSLSQVVHQHRQDIIYICSQDTAQTILTLQSLVDLAASCPIVTLEADNQMTSQWPEQEFCQHSHIHFAKTNSEIYDYSNIFGNKQDMLAIAIHDSYVEQQKALGMTAEDNSSLVAWSQLPEVLKNANRNQADHIGIKCRYLTGKSLPTPEELETAMATSNLQLLAKMEHQRWLAEKKLAGWHYTEGEKDPVRRLSPSMIDWDALSESEKQKDVNTVAHLPQLLSLLNQNG